MYSKYSITLPIHPLTSITIFVDQLHYIQIKEDQTHKRDAIVGTIYSIRTKKFFKEKSATHYCKPPFADEDGKSKKNI